GHQHIERCARAEQPIDRNDRGHGAGGAPAEPARQRQALADGQGDAAALAELRQKRLGRDAGGVPRRIARQPAAVTGDVVDPDAALAAGKPRGHLVARLAQREPEHVEATGDVGDGGGGKGGDPVHGNSRHLTWIVQSPGWRERMLRSRLQADHSRRYRSRMVGIRYSRNARSKSYFGANPQSFRAAESSTAAG